MNLVIFPLLGFVLLLPHVQAAESSPFTRELKDKIASVQTSRRSAPTTSQEAVMNALNRYSEALKACEFDLTPDGRISAAVDQAPTWLAEAARVAFLEEGTLPDQILNSLRNHNFLINVRMSVAGVDRDRAESIRQLIRRALVDSNPLATSEIGRSVEIKISDVNITQAANVNRFSFKLAVTFAGGQIQALQFRDAPMGSFSPEVAIARLTVGAVNHRAVLSSDAKLRQEMNAFRYDLLKNVRVARPEAAATLAALAKTLEQNQPKSGFFRNLFSGSSRFTGVDTVLGSAFQTYFYAKEEFLNLAQRMKEEELASQQPVAQAPRRGLFRRTSVPVVKPDAQFIPQRPNPLVQGRMASGYYRPRHVQSDREQSSTLSDMMWFWDPGFMLSHPWYWGAKDGSFWSYWMMYSWMSEKQNRPDDHVVTQPAQPYSPGQLSTFDQPVDPVFTRNSERPVVDVWDSNSVSAREMIGLNTSSDGDITWTDSRGRATDIFEVSGRDLSDRWSQTTGQPAEEASAEQRTETFRSEGERSRFDEGRDGTGWGRSESTPPVESERDSGIRSS